MVWCIVLCPGLNPNRSSRMISFSVRGLLILLISLNLSAGKPFPLPSLVLKCRLLVCLQGLQVNLRRRLCGLLQWFVNYFSKMFQCIKLFSQYLLSFLVGRGNPELQWIGTFLLRKRSIVEEIAVPWYVGLGGEFT